MDREPYDAKRISKFIGSLGKIGTPPDFWFVDEAAKELRMSFAELNEHPRKREYMSYAFSLRQGRSDGEFARRLNPVYIQQIKDARKQLDEAEK